MNRITPPILLCVVGGCVAGPGIFGATASETSGGGGEASSTGDAVAQDNSSSGTTSADPEAETHEPRLDVAGPGDCDGLDCGLSAVCVGPYIEPLAIAMHPEGGSVAFSYSDASDDFLLLASGSDQSRALPEPPSSFTRLDLAFDPQGRAATLFGREDGYLLQLRASSSYDTVWSRAYPGDEPSGRRTTTTDIAADGAGTIHVAGYSIDETVGAESTEVFVRSYDAGGGELETWTHAAIAQPLLAADHGDGTVIVWTSTGGGTNVEHPYLVRRLDHDGEVVESHDVSFPIEIVGRPSRRASGWLVVGAKGLGLEVHAMGVDFAQNSVHEDVPAGPSEAFLPRAIAAVGDAWVVLVHRPVNEESSVALREYEADGTRLIRDPEVEFRHYDADFSEVASDGLWNIHFYIVEADGEGDSSRCSVEYGP